MKEWLWSIEEETGEQILRNVASILFGNKSKLRFVCTITWSICTYFTFTLHQKKKKIHNWKLQFGKNSNIVTGTPFFQ